MWKGISKRAVRQEPVKKSELVQIAEGRRDGKVESGRNRRLLSPNSQQGQTEWSHFFVCASVNTEIFFIKVASNLSGFTHNKPIYACTFAGLCLLERLPLRLQIAQHPPTLSVFGFHLC